LQLVEGLSAGASVDGLRIAWYEDGSHPVRISLDGVGVEFEVPEVVRFKGAVAYRTLTVGTETVHRFDGRIVLELLSLDLRIEATLVIGSATGDEGTYTFFAIYLDAELPAGIPLFSTGLALYGMAGLFALSMEPDKHDDEEWYGIGPGEGWYHRGTVGVTDLQTKWINRRGSLALGAGVTIGTISDNGYTFSGKVLFVLVFPGPILLVQGKANLLKERSKLTDEPIFRALAVLDNRAGTFLIGLDAHYKYGDSGDLIDIRGSVEAFYSMSDANAWHLYLGMREPRSKRIQAEIFKLFQANAYWMLDARQLAMGAWLGYDKKWKFGPLSVTIEAWIEGNALLSFKPVHLSGELWLHGKAALKVFGFGASLHVDARFAAEVFDPFHLLAEFSVGISLPWPFDDIDADITLEWGPTPTNPPLPLPLKEIAVEHLKVTESWPLPRGASPPLLAPNYDGNGDGFRDAPNPSVATQAAAAAPGNAPVVPVDARPRLTFGRSVHDDALVGVNAGPVSPEYERVGDPAKNEGPTRVRFGLKEVALDRATGGGWTTVAWKGTTPNPSGVPRLWGSWAPLPALPDGGGENVGQTKLWLWSKSPFDYTRHNGAAWDDWFTDRFNGYPCPPPLNDRIVCVNFTKMRESDIAHSPWTVPGSEGLELVWSNPQDLGVTVLSQPVAGKKQAVCFTRVKENAVVINPPFPASTIRVVVASTPTPSTPECVDLRKLEQGAHSNPLKLGAIQATVYDNNGKAPGNTIVVTIRTPAGTLTGLNAGFKLEIVLPCPATSVQITATHFAAVPVARAFNTSGGVVDQVSLSGPNGQVQSITLSGKDIVKVTIESLGDETFLHELCYTCGGSEESSLTAMGETEDGGVIGPVSPVGNVITVTSADSRLVSVALRPKSQVCVVEICCTIPPDPAEVTAREEMAQHLRDELAHWSQTGDVLQSHTTYRLKVVTKLETSDASIGDHEHTEFAYFRTEGPPGLTQLSEPIGYSNPGEFVSALKDLTRYVRQTVPSTVPAPGSPPRLPRPVYRGYDVGVEFNEDYVDVMYSLDRRDLGLYLFDNNSQPLRDDLGRLVVLTNRWGRADTLTLTDSETRWITTIDASTCVDQEITGIPRDNTLVVGVDGLVLAPDTLHEARLIPLLLHEDFTQYAVGDAASGPAGQLGDWVIHDEAPNSGPSRWEIRETGVPPSRYVVQTTNMGGGTADGRDPVKPGTVLLRADDPVRAATDAAQPGNWTDYRFTVYVRSESEDAIGVVFRYWDTNNHYLFAMDRERKYRRLMRMVGGVTTVLAEDDWVYQQNTDYRITVEAIGTALNIHIDGTPLFAVRDDSFDSGRIGLYCWADEGARFSDVRVDDYRADAPVPYSFTFTTSRFVDVFHHLHDFDDETWLADVGAAAIDAPLAVAVALPTTISEAESRAYEALAQVVLGQEAFAPVDRVKVSRVEKNGTPVCLFIQTAEPIDWTRTALDIAYADRLSPVLERPELTKLTDVTFGGNQPNDESVIVLLREPRLLSGDRIERLAMPSPLPRLAGDPLLLRDDFDFEGGLIFHETFGPNALDHYTVVDQGDVTGPSVWSVSAGRIVQTSNIYGGSVAANAAEKPGTVALVGESAWSDVRISAAFGSTDNDSVGLVFRYQNEDNYYRFSMDAERAFRRLVKRVGGVTTVLWEDATIYAVGRTYQIDIVVSADRLLGYADDELLFSVRDGDLPAGRLGMYCWANQGAFFERLDVEQLESPSIVWAPVFTDLSEIEIETASGVVNGPAVWAAAGGTLTQSSDVHVPDETADRLGTAAVSRTGPWEDMTISAALLSTTNGALGIMFRYTDASNYYRFSMGQGDPHRRLVKRVAGVTTTLWEDGSGYTVGQTHALTVRVRGSGIHLALDGVALTTVFDSDLVEGRAALYCWSNAGASFANVVVIDATRRVGAWTIRDDTSNGGPSFWRQRGGELLQTTAIGGGAAPDFPGTVVLRGRADWSDYRMRVRLRSDGDGALGLVFRYLRGSTHYRFSMDRQQHYRRLVKRLNGIVTTLWEDATPYASGAEMEITIDAIGSRLVGYVDDTQLFSVEDASIPNGRVGLYSWNNPDVRFGRVEVRAPSVEARALFQDRFAAGDTSGWTFVDEGAVNGPSAWTAASGVLRQASNILDLPLDPIVLNKRGTLALAGNVAWRDITLTARLRSEDDDAIGLVFRYADANNFYRFSMDRERGYRRLVKCFAGVFTHLWGDAMLYQTGQWYEITITCIGSLILGYIDGIPMFVVDDASLVAGRVGLYCWANQDARFSHVRVFAATARAGAELLDDPLQVLVVGRWATFDEGDQEGPSQWSIVDGALQQSSTIHGGDAAPSAVEKPGTFLVAGDAGWSDYRLTVRIRSDSDEGIGLMFRYVDTSNYYRFSMDHTRSVRRLTRKVAGVVTSLWDDNVAFDVGREYVVTIDCVGQRLRGFLDGVSIFVLDDAALERGRIALYSWNNDGARFSELTVVAPTWVSYYTFDEDEPLAAGTRLRVYGGSESAAHADPSGALPRFAAALGEEGMLTFGNESVQLRFRAPSATSGHAREFLSTSDWTNVEYKVLRKNDATAFFLVEPSLQSPGSALNAGTYRLSLTYRRDNTAFDPPSQVLRKAGDSNPEVVTIDVPWETT
jgi:hypothetical protein